jgi:hypothetical protein
MQAIGTCSQLMLFVHFMSTLHDLDWNLVAASRRTAATAP